MRQKKYLVTGGSGFIGSSLVKSLLKKGYFVRVLDNNSRGDLRRLKTVIDKIDFIQGDIRDLNEVKKACKGIDVVCHLAFINGTRFFYEVPELVLEVGVKGMMNVLDSCLVNDVGELILASSSEVYQSPKKVPTAEDVSLIVPDLQNPRFSYGGGKIISELLAINYGRKNFERVIIFRPHNVYGPDMGWEHVIPQFINKMEKLSRQAKDEVEFPIQGSGSETRSFIYIDDFTDAYGSITNLNLGLHTLKKTLEQRRDQHAIERTRYAINLMYLENMLQKNVHAMTSLANQIERINLQYESVEESLAEIIQNLGSLYREYISSLGPKIIVEGNPAYLKLEQHTNMIRALLLASIRAIVLWRQAQGKRWALLFGRHSILKNIAALDQGI